MQTQPKFSSLRVRMYFVVCSFVCNARIHFYLICLRVCCTFVFGCAMQCNAMHCFLIRWLHDSLMIIIDTDKCLAFCESKIIQKETHSVSTLFILSFALLLIFVFYSFYSNKYLLIKKKKKTKHYETEK